MTWFYFACDGNGTDSIQSILNQHPEEIKSLEVDSYATWDAYTRDLVSTIKPGDTVILDTITMFAEQTRGDLKLGNDRTISYWEHHKKLLGETNHGADYAAAGKMIIRRLKDLKGKGARIIVTAHEKEKEDTTIVPPVKRRGPDLNNDLVSSLMGSSSDVARLRVVFEDEYGEGKTVRFKQGQRLLEFGPSEEFRSKVQVPLEFSGKTPATIVRPSYTKMCKLLQKTPTWLTVYGPSGTGKSTFALSSFIDPEGNGIGF